MDSLRGQPLSPQEVQIVHLVARGMTNADIGARLHMSTPTARRKLTRIGEKFGFTCRAGIVGAAIRGGYLVVPVTAGLPAGFDKLLFDVLVRVAHGKANSEIGAELELSTEAVRSRVRRLLAVLAVRSREEAVVAGVACGALRLVPARHREQVAA